MPYKKKIYTAMPQVRQFIAEQSAEVQAEYQTIVDMLEVEGRLTMPYGEKIESENLFAIRVIKAGNIRVFYVYGMGTDVFGIYGYVKKTQDIPDHEMKKAKKICKILKQGGYIK